MGRLFPEPYDPQYQLRQDGTAQARSDWIAAFLHYQHGGILQKARELRVTDPEFAAAHLQDARYVSPRLRTLPAVWIDADALERFRFRFERQTMAQARYIEVLRDPDPVGRLLDYVLAHGAFIHPAPDGNRLRVPGALLDDPVLGRQLRMYAGALMARAMEMAPTCDCPRPAPWPTWAVTEGQLLADTWGAF
jgi:hypothetical protein